MKLFESEKSLFGMKTSAKPLFCDFPPLNNLFSALPKHYRTLANQSRFQIDAIFKLEKTPENYATTHTQYKLRKIFIF